VRYRIRTPAGLEETTRSDLLDGLAAHEAVLVEARHGIGPPRGAEELRAAGLGALAYGPAPAESAIRWEWIARVQALRNDATLAEVAAACGLEPDEVTPGLRSRVSAQIDRGLITPATGREALALIDTAMP
jgi:hypothetical protein